MDAGKISLALDEELIRRTRQQDCGGAGKSDVEVIEDALAVYLGLIALDAARDAARAQGILDPEQADRLAVEEVRATRRKRHRAA